MGHNENYVRKIEADIVDEPVGFAAKYKLGIVRALITRDWPARLHFGTGDLEGLLKALDPAGYKAFLDALHNPPSTP
jgi:hypothetical protein